MELTLTLILLLGLPFGYLLFTRDCKVLWSTDVSSAPGTAGVSPATEKYVISVSQADETSANPDAGETPALHKLALL